MFELFFNIIKKQVRYFNWSNYFVHSLYYLSLYFTIDNDILLYYYPISQLCHQFYIKATYNEATIYVRMFFLHPLFFFFFIKSYVIVHLSFVCIILISSVKYTDCIGDIVILNVGLYHFQCTLIFPSEPLAFPTRTHV